MTLTQPVCGFRKWRQRATPRRWRLPWERFPSGKRDLKTAETCFQNAVKLDPKFSDAYSALGNLYLAKQDVKQAEQAFKTAMELSSSRPEKTLLYAQFKILTGDPDTGKSLLQAMVKKTPGYLPAWIALAQLAGAEKDYAGGLTLLGNVLSRDSRNLDALLLKARLEMQKGDTAQAIKDLERMAQNFPEHARRLLSTGRGSGRDQ